MTLKTKLIAAGALVAASFAAIPAANAGGVSVQLGFGSGHGYNEPYADVRHNRFVSERRIHRILRENGYRPLDVWRQGRFYLAKAHDRRGRVFQIRLSAFDGDIVSVRGERHNRGHRWH